MDTASQQPQSSPAVSTTIPTNSESMLPYVSVIWVIILIAATYLIYTYTTTPSKITSTSFNKTYDMVGNGAGNMTIAVSVLNGFNQPLSNITVNALASIGHANYCVTAEDGICTIDYFSPRNATLSHKNDKISISVKNLEGTVNINITPDYAMQVSLETDATNQSIFTGWVVNIVAKATDNSGNPVPDGSVVNFSLTNGGGTLSAYRCTTIAGQCNITYQAPQNPAQVSLSYSSGRASDQYNLRVLQIPVFNYTANGTVYTYSVANGSVVLPSNYDYYLCAAAPGLAVSQLTSWKTDFLNGASGSIGHQTNNICTTSPLESTGLSIVGIAIRYPLNYTLFGTNYSGHYNPIPGAFNYTVVADNSTTVILGAVQGAVGFSTSLPTGCEVKYSENTKTQTQSSVTPSSTSYVAICNNQLKGVYQVSNANVGGGTAATSAAYVFPP